jgi:hypothetical protein
MEPKEYLQQVVDAIIRGDQQQAKDAHHAYIELKTKDMLKEDHDVLLTSEGLETFIKTLHKRAKKAKKEEAFLMCLGKHSGHDNCSVKDFASCADHLAKNKKKADKFIHAVEHELKLEKDDPAKDIKGE